MIPSIYYFHYRRMLWLWNMLGVKSDFFLLISTCPRKETFGRFVFSRCCFTLNLTFMLMGLYFRPTENTFGNQTVELYSRTPLVLSFFVYIFVMAKVTFKQAKILDIFQQANHLQQRFGCKLQSKTILMFKFVVIVSYCLAMIPSISYDWYLDKYDLRWTRLCGLYKSIDSSCGPAFEFSFWHYIHKFHLDELCRAWIHYSCCKTRNFKNKSVELVCSVADCWRLRKWLIIKLDQFKISKISSTI